MVKEVRNERLSEVSGRVVTVWLGHLSVNLMVLTRDYPYLAVNPIIFLAIPPDFCHPILINSYF